ncbi:uncharacterized protein isoform X2 [Musca autumnalis]|uniref:uncharacterized protein isoform X2 n=1 Tax=Musca autumnalis TaxID=221902 RepID=UPI003CE858DD
MPRLQCNNKKNEEISIEELKLIKHRHIRQLLKNYKMGVRIRFEHYFEIWRNRIGMPFQIEDLTEESTTSCNCKHGSGQNIYNGHAMAMIYETLAKDSLTSDSFHTTIKSPPLLAENNISRNEELSTKMSLRSVVAQRCSTEDNTPSDNEHYSTPGGGGGGAGDIAPRNKMLCPYNLPQILQMIGERGIEIVKYYEEHKAFTATQRSELIRVICDFFEEHNYNLSLQVSYKLEREILQMFPNEEMHYYRTDRRGKIYVRFINKKRWRKVRHERHFESMSSQNAHRDETTKSEHHQQIAEDEDDNISNCDAWFEETTAKEEIIKSDVQNEN